MRKVFAILEGLACLMVFVCCGVLAEVLVIGLLEISGVFEHATLRPAWVFVFPIIFGIVGFRLGFGAALEMMMLKAGAKYEIATRFAYAWVAGVALWGVLVWLAVAQGYGPFSQPHWDIMRTLILALVLGGLPTLAVVLARFVLRLKRAPR